MPKTSCPATWYRSAGSFNDWIVIEVSDAVGDTLVDVTAVQGILEDVDGNLADVNLTATVTDSAAREVTVQLGTWLQNTAQVGQAWWVSLDITVSGISIVRFPERPSKRLGLYIV